MSNVIFNVIYAFEVQDSASKEGIFS